MPSLTRNPGDAASYTLHLPPDCEEAWLNVGNASIRVARTEEGFTLAVHASGDEEGDPIVETWVTDSELEPAPTWKCPECGAWPEAPSGFVNHVFDCDQIESAHQPAQIAS